MKTPDFRTGWMKFIRWHGWGDFLRWEGWAKLLFPPAPLVVLLALLSAAGLVWVFTCGMSQHPLGYAIYCLAFYALVTVIAVIPALVRGIRIAAQSSPLAGRYQLDAQQKFSLRLYFDQCLNMVYGIVKTVLGLLYSSAWIGADGLYNLAQGIIQLFLILGRKRKPDAPRQWKSYRRCGWMLLVLHLTMTGPIYQMVNLDRHATYPGYMIFLTALFTFYKLIKTFIRVVKDRKHKAPIDSAVRLMDLCQAWFNLFSLQVAMLHQFGGGMALSRLMNSLTACGVCVMVFATGIYMIRRGKRELNKL